MVCHSASRQLLPTASSPPNVSRLGAGCPAAAASSAAAASTGVPPRGRTSEAELLPIRGNMSGQRASGQMRPVANLALWRWPLLLTQLLDTPGCRYCPCCCGCEGMNTGCKGAGLQTALANPGGRVRRIAVWPRLQPVRTSRSVPVVLPRLVPVSELARRLPVSELARRLPVLAAAGDWSSS